jgi:pimeloyl-ACP methyl ester carboxylesterase
MVSPPSFGKLLREALDIPRVVAAPLLRPAFPGKLANGEPVLVIPGFLSDDNPTSRLRRTFDAAAFRCSGWELGFNRGIRTDIVERMAARVSEVSRAAGGQKVVLVGWSLGGLYARELGHHMPDSLRLIVTLGSPFAGDLRANNAWRLYELLNSHKVDALPIATNFARKPSVYTVAVWSPIDGIVSPESAQGSLDQSDEQIELRETHLGFASTRTGVEQIVRIVADRI